MMTIIEVRVELKKGITDPEGKNIKKTLELLGFNGILDVRSIKTFKIDLDAPTDRAKLLGEKMCHQLLSNPVIQNYSVSVR